LLCIASVVSS